MSGIHVPMSLFNEILLPPTPVSGIAVMNMLQTDRVGYHYHYV